MKRVFCVAFILLGTSSLMSVARSQAPFAEESPINAEVREVVFRYMFDHYNYGAHVKVYCIEAERPLPDSFIQRFSQIKPHVVWAFECDNSGPMMSIRNKKTGESGMRMTILSIQWIKRQEAEVKVSAFSDGIAANWNTLRVLFGQGHWKIVNDKLDGVS